jgi:hypothetical protein
MFDRTVHEEAVASLLSALQEIIPAGDPAELRERAEAMAALAFDYDIRIEHVRQNFILFPRHDGDYSLETFQRWALEVRKLAEIVLAKPLPVCPSCHSVQLQRSGNVIYCANCGDIT